MTKLRVVAVGKLADELVHESGCADSLDFRTRDTLRTTSASWASEAHSNVLVDSYVEENTRLRDASYLFSDPVLVEIPDVLIVKLDYAVFGVELIHEEEQLSNRRLR